MARQGAREDPGDKFDDVDPEGHMGALAWAILGLAAGAIARSLHDGRRPGGLPAAMAIGAAGALLGGFVATAVGIGAVGSLFHVGTWLIAIGGAFLLLMLFEALSSSYELDHQQAESARRGQGALT
jgi:uncharacterized membrane protein YeaQ/YmgE (transglycosylase-associated protein family)